LIIGKDDANFKAITVGRWISFEQVSLGKIVVVQQWQELCLT
jgi:hypothetical protein